jgi:hypothetical protein
MNNIAGTRPLEYGNLDIVSVEDCPGNCDKVTTTLVPYPCDCNKEFERKVVSYYASNKKYNPNQYGTISDLKYLDTSNCVTYLFKEKPKTKFNLIGGLGTTQYCDTVCTPSTSTTFEYEYCTNGTLHRRREKTVAIFADCTEQISYSAWVITNVCPITTYPHTFVTGCDCIPITWTNTGVTACNSNVSQIQQVSNCGTFRFINGGNACPNCGVTQLAVTLQCRNNGMEVILKPYNNCSSNPNDFGITVTNSSNNGININRVSHNKYVIENNQPFNLTTHTDVTITGFGDTFTYDIWTNTCDHDNCPLACSDTDLGQINVTTWDGTNIVANYVNPNLLPWQTINWYNDNTQVLINSLIFTGTKIGGNYVKLQAQPSQYNSGQCYCHGFNQLYLR